MGGREQRRERSEFGFSWSQCSGNEVTHALMDSAGARSGYQPGFSKAGKRRRPSGATVKARGLPYSTSEYDLVEFFAEYGVSQASSALCWDFYVKLASFSFSLSLLPSLSSSSFSHQG